MTSPKTTKAEARGSFGIVGGLWALSGADVLFKLLKSIHPDGRSERCKAIFEQHPFHDPTDSRAATIERYFRRPEFEVLHPRAVDGVDCVTCAAYGNEGIRSGNPGGRAVELMREACMDLLAQGADVILPGLLNDRERKELDGRMNGDMRNGPVTIELKGEPGDYRKLGKRQLEHYRSTEVDRE
ncbi:hypothetical protein [Paraburkholderia pallida]|uniref:Uncharacterized protein n=1 Tax=Paraburkholderia pallida TaxID=2547399 RepID=A0A4P7CYH5_9BURK|nr:hypothetical protein [Paraburkholderia pallida]QBQ99876.1 hypothetical protein E1956_22375 [Paraburkholderia pallida]